jgi:hypothetical protein
MRFFTNIHAPILRESITVNFPEPPCKIVSNLGNAIDNYSCSFSFTSCKCWKQLFFYIMQMLQTAFLLHHANVGNSFSFTSCKCWKQLFFDIMKMLETAFLLHHAKCWKQLFFDIMKMLNE